MNGTTAFCSSCGRLSAWEASRVTASMSFGNKPATHVCEGNSFVMMEIVIIDYPLLKKVTWLVTPSHWPSPATTNQVLTTFQSVEDDTMYIMCQILRIQILWPKVTAATNWFSVEKCLGVYCFSADCGCSLPEHHPTNTKIPEMIQWTTSLLSIKGIPGLPPNGITPYILYYSITGLLSVYPPQKPSHISRLPPTLMEIIVVLFTMLTQDVMSLYQSNEVTH